MSTEETTDTPEPIREVDGVPTDPENIEGVRQELIAWRNATLESDKPDFQFAVLMSHAIVMLYELKELKERG